MCGPVKYCETFTEIFAGHTEPIHNKEQHHDTIEHATLICYLMTFRYTSKILLSDFIAFL